MVDYSNGKFYTSRVRWQAKNNYLLWLTTDEKDMYWPGTDGRVPAFATAAEVVALTKRLGINICVEEPVLQNLDVVMGVAASTVKASSERVFDGLAYVQRPEFRCSSSVQRRCQITRTK